MLPQLLVASTAVYSDHGPFFKEFIKASGFKMKLLNIEVPYRTHTEHTKLSHIVLSLGAACSRLIFKLHFTEHF